MSCNNCKAGFAWDGKPTGSDKSTLAGLPTYVSGESKDVGILLCAEVRKAREKGEDFYDIFGWKLNNARLLADHFAKELKATVYVPDFYEGEIVDPNMFSDPEKMKSFDLGEWTERHNRVKRWPAVEACAKELRAKYSKLGAIGYCWGGWAVFQLSGESLVDAISTAHPAMFNEKDVDSVKTPIQLLAPEEDMTFTPELKKYCLENLPKTGVPWEYIYFEGHKHGFASRGDPSTDHGRAGFERAKRSAVNFFTEFLH
ncbi:hypothetical protein LTR62_004530 [Meristemomyces frigidus]|uniref:Dienelactone hydrolase domain-containing protein n=1 Tax=Meristemomyces frigidus TaxID=1508187 RepID=A0AAN7YJV8_9PEZI|nr:hypothetical protein LTR62_004530 [Meristemomyces frigidus]